MRVRRGDNGFQFGKSGVKGGTPGCFWRRVRKLRREKELGDIREMEECGRS